MGLLDDVLGQLTGADGAGAKPVGGSDRAATSNLGPIVTALLPVVLAMLAGRGRTQSADAQQTGGGGIGDLLGQMLDGNSAGASGAGGLGGLLEQFARAGFGDQVGSWVGSGQNQPIAPDAIEKVFGGDGLAEIARRAGVSQQDAARGLSQLMPEVVDRMTPNGRVPDVDSLTASVAELAKRLGRA